MPSDPHTRSAALASLRTLRLASLGEGATLLLLLFIAVPLKRLAGWPTGVSVMGPIHGAAFLMYAALVLRNASAGHLSTRETVLLLVAAFVPFGAFLVGGIFKRKAIALA
jgi:integral membrane protein